MDVVSERCAGLDVHKQTVVACRLTPGERGQPRREIGTFGTMPEDRLALGDWLAEGGCTHVAMESTGGYWQPSWTLLEDRFTLLLVNAKHVKAVPGRKTDVRDCEGLAELGADLGRFPTAGHLAAWAGLCPGNHQSAGKRRSGRTRKGDGWLRTALLEAAQAAGRTKRSYLGARYRRLAARRGKKRAAVAVAHTLLVISYHLLTSADPYRDLGPDFFDRRVPEALDRRLIGRLERRGYTVTRKPEAA